MSKLFATQSKLVQDDNIDIHAYIHTTAHSIVR